MDREAERQRILTEIAAAREVFEKTVRPLKDQLERLYSTRIRDSSADLTSHPNRLPGMVQTLVRASLTNSQKQSTAEFSQLETITINIEYASKTPLTGVGFSIYSLIGIRVGGANNYMAEPPPHRIPNEGRYSFTLAARQLAPGSYFVNVSVNSHQNSLQDKVDDCLRFTVQPADIYGSGYLPTENDGLVQLEASFEIIAN